MNCKLLKNNTTTLLTISIVLSIIAISMNVLQCTITNESIVLAFVGILATFVVVSNFAQVSDIKKDFISGMKSIDKIDNKIIEVKAEIDKSLSSFNIEEKLSLMKIIEWRSNIDREATWDEQKKWLDKLDSIQAFRTQKIDMEVQDLLQYIVTRISVINESQIFCITDVLENFVNTQILHGQQSEYDLVLNQALDTCQDIIYDVFVKQETNDYYLKTKSVFFTIQRLKRINKCDISNILSQINSFLNIDSISSERKIVLRAYFKEVECYLSSNNKDFILPSELYNKLSKE